jgi:hypothetical protein
MPILISNEEAERRAAQAMQIPDTMRAWAWAIYKHEGGRPNDRNMRNNNPGNLKYFGQKYAQPEHSITPANPHPFAKFDSLTDGWIALYHQLRKYVHDHPNYTLLNWASLYLGNRDPLVPEVTPEGDPFKYADAVTAAVASRLGIDVSAIHTATLDNLFEFVSPSLYASKTVSSDPKPGRSVPGK